jgi:hypothetical protein
MLSGLGIVSRIAQIPLDLAEKVRNLRHVKIRGDS